MSNVEDAYNELSEAAAYTCDGYYGPGLVEEKAQALAHTVLDEIEAGRWIRDVRQRLNLLKVEEHQCHEQERAERREEESE